MSLTTGSVTTFSGDDSLPESFRQRLSDRFVLAREIGRGGMATVWLARRRVDDVDIAIKVLRPTIANALMTRRFLREIEIMSSLRAPGLVPLEEAGEVDGLPFFVMPFIGGPSLRQKLDAERQLSVVEAHRVTREISAALGFLHAAGIVHRDIKPENILFTVAGEALLADYGISRAISAAATEAFTTTGVVLGTPAYMSPEQSAGEPVDQRSDIYSLGCVAFEMLAGVPPFQGASQQAVLSRHQLEPPPRISIVRPTVAAEFEAVIDQALAKVPADRFANTADLLRALDSGAVSVEFAHEPRRSVPTKRAYRRAPLLAAASIVIAAAAIASVLYDRSRAPLDNDRVLVFPFTEMDTTRGQEGEQLAMLVGSALERTEPMKLARCVATFIGRGATTTRCGVDESRPLSRAVGTCTLLPSRLCLAHGRLSACHRRAV